MFAKHPPLLIILAAVAACATDDRPDARILPPVPTADARVATPDARPADAGMATADARLADAPVATPDAPVAMPDAPVAMPDAMQTPDAMEPTPDAMVPTGEATLIINEVSPSGDNDLVELLAVTGGTVNDITLYQDITADVELLARLPDVTVAADDIIVLHLQPDPALADELAAVDDCGETACYDGAWDFIGETDSQQQEVGYSHRVIYLLTAGESYMDAVPFTRTGNPRDAFVPDLQFITMEGPAENPGIDFWQNDCGTPCDFMDGLDNLRAATVDWTGAGMPPSGDTVQRKTGAPDTRSVEDWQPGGAQPQTLGLPN